MRPHATLTIILFLFGFLATILVVRNANTNNGRVIESSDTNNVIKIEESVKSTLNKVLCECETKQALVKETTDIVISTDFSAIKEISDTEVELNSSDSSIPIPTVFVITPTYTRPTQMPDMTRLAQTLMHIKQLVWIVVEDSKAQSALVRALLERTNLQYVHLLGPRPEKHLDKKSGRGVSNRLKGFEWLRAMYANTDQKGVIYLADDDNSYDIRLFDEIRDTKKVSMFPVGLLPVLGLSTPIVSKITGKIIGFHDPWIGGRKFALDMAGFAVNLQYFLSKPKATMPYIVGYEEDRFIRSLDLELNDIEPKANNCTEILVWHTKTNSGEEPKYENLVKSNYSNLAKHNFTDTYLTDLYYKLMNIT